MQRFYEWFGWWAFICELSNKVFSFIQEIAPLSLDISRLSQFISGLRGFIFTFPPKLFRG
jgi:hypothetical protein